MTIMAHQYSTRICPNCGADFCWACCGGTNVHEGGKHQPDFMLCPQCGQDMYEGGEGDRSEQAPVGHPLPLACFEIEGES